MSNTKSPEPFKPFTGWVVADENGRLYHRESQTVFTESEANKIQKELNSTYSKFKDASYSCEVVPAGTLAAFQACRESSGGMISEIATLNTSLTNCEEDRDDLRKELDTSHKVEARMRKTLGACSETFKGLKDWYQQVGLEREELRTGGLKIFDGILETIDSALSTPTAPEITRVEAR